MDLAHILSELRREASRINDAIVVIENLIKTTAKRRGRPPKWTPAPSAKVTQQPEHPKAGSKE